MDVTSAVYIFTMEELSTFSSRTALALFVTLPNHSQTTRSSMGYSSFAKGRRKRSIASHFQAHEVLAVVYLSAPSLCRQHLPSVSDSILSLKTGSLTSTTSSGCTTGLGRCRSKAENALVEVLSRPDTKTAFFTKMAFLFTI